MRVFNKKYWPHQIRLDKGAYKNIWLDNDEDLKKIERWCYDTLKSKDWHNSGYYFVFKRGKDATMFTLRWV